MRYLNTALKGGSLFSSARILSVLLLIIFPLYLLGTAAVPAGGSPRADSPAGQVRLVLNGWLLQTDVPPQLVAGRTLLPLRFVGEAIGARVAWDEAARTVELSKEKGLLVLGIDQLEARVNGQVVPLDVPPQIIQGRTMVPLRFLAENLGASVHWDEAQRIVFLDFQDVPSPPGHGLRPYDPAEPAEIPPAEPREDLQAYYYDDLDLEVHLYGIRLGESRAAVHRKLGSPAWEMETLYGYSKLAYPGRAHYLALGIKEDRVVSLYAAGEEWRFGPVNEEVALKTVQEEFALADYVYVEQLNSYLQAGSPLVKYENMLVTFYPDRLNGNRIAALRLEDRSVARDRFAAFYRFRSGESDQQQVGDQLLREAERADERLLFDLANYERLRRGTAPLEWHAAAARAALAHSREMYSHAYFNHFSPLTGKGPSERLRDEDVNFQRMAENIARGQTDAIEAHHGLMNSVHHRPAILNPEYRSLGTGVRGDCFTQKYVTEF